MCSCSVVSDSLWPHDNSPLGSSVHGDSPGKNTGVGCHALLQGIFPTQGSNPGLPHCRQLLYCLSHQASPRILEWVACPFSRGSSQPGCHFLDLPLLPGCHFLIARVFQIIILRGGVKGWSRVVQDQEVALSPIGLTGAKPISGATLSARGEVAVLEGQPGHMSLDCWLRIHIPRMCAVLSGALHVPIMVLFLGVFKYSFMSCWQFFLMHPRNISAISRVLSHLFSS